ncbi:MAG TPA: tetratricopeptide repeat protein [Gemmatimonadaceae bacterium]|nr:tetratricopeptide repeat protein [Gemmatimonadaceae bacterium]
MANSDLINELLAQFNANPRRVFARLANEYRKAGDPQSAIDLCRTHVPLQPSYISGHIVFGQALFERGELDEARTAFETAISLDPENLIAIRQLGDIARVTGDSRSARVWYERLLEMDPQNEEIEQYLRDLPAAGAEEPGEIPAAMEAEVDAGATEQATEPMAEPATEPGAGEAPQASPDEEPIVAEPAVPEPSWPEPASEPRQDAATVEHTADQEPLGVSAPSEPADAGIERQHDPFDWSMLAPSTEPAISDAESLIDVTDLSPDEPDRAESAEPPAMFPEESASDFQSFDMNAVMFPEIELSESPGDQPLPESAAELLGGEIDLPRSTTRESWRAEGEEGLADAEALLPVTEDAAADVTAEAPPELPSEAAAEAAPAAAREARPESTAESTAEATAEATAEPTAEPTVGAEPAAEAVGSTAFVTETLAELYLRQGHQTEALAIYHQVAARRPDDTALRDRIARLESTQASRAATQRTGRTIREFFATVMTRRAPVPGRSGGVAVEATGNGAEGASATEPTADPVGADGLFSVNVIPLEDDARAGVLASAYLADVTHPVSPGTTPGGESFSLEHVFRDEAGAAPLPSASMPDVSFDEFFARKPEETSPEPRGSAAPPAEPKPGDDDLELFQAWLEGLKK